MYCVRSRWISLLVLAGLCFLSATFNYKIFNSALRHQTVPFAWKLADVSPIPKESPINNCNQLRPISLTNIIMRIFENLVCKQELSPALKLQIRSDQFVYKEGHNTIMAFLKYQHYYCTSPEQHYVYCF